MPCGGALHRRCHCDGSDGGVRIAGAIMQAVTKSSAIETFANYSRDMSGISGGGSWVDTPDGSCLVEIVNKPPVVAGDQAR